MVESHIDAHRTATTRQTTPLVNETISASPVAAVLNDHERRLTALEQQSRGYQEDGALAAGRSAGDGECMSVAERAKCSQEIARLRSRNDSLDTELGEVRTRLEAERDEWQSRARAADQESEHHHAAGNTARAALRKLRKYARHDDMCERRRFLAACNCGLDLAISDALAGGEANEGSGE